MAKADQFNVEYHHRHYPSQVAERYEVMSRVGNAPNVAYFVVRTPDKRFLGTLVTISSKKMSRATDAVTRLTAAIQKEVDKGTGTFAPLKKAVIALRAATEKTSPPDRSAKAKGKDRKAATVAGAKPAAKPVAGKTTSGAKPVAKTTAGAKPAEKPAAARTTAGAKPAAKPATTAGKPAAGKTTAGPGKKKGKKAKAAPAVAPAAKKAAPTTAGPKKGKKKGKKKKGAAPNDRKAPADNGTLPPPGMPSEERFWNGDAGYQQEARSVGLATGSYPQSMLPPPAAAASEQYAGVVGGPSSQTEREWDAFVRQVQAAEKQQRAGGTAQGQTTQGQTTAGASDSEVAPYEQYMGMFYPDR